MTHRKWDVIAQAILAFVVVMALVAVTAGWWRHHRIRVWAKADTYKKADARLGSPAPGENRVVFFGDSITQGWNLETFFPGRPYVNRGINGQNTDQMMIRFDQDVIALKPSAVVILAGLNDAPMNVNAPDSTKRTEANIVAMAEKARAYHIQVILCSITPVLHGPEDSSITPRVWAVSQWTRKVNSRLESYAQEHGFGFVDYYSALHDQRGLLPAEFTNDGWHPNARGYAPMARLLEPEIERVLRMNVNGPEIQGGQ